MRLLKWLKSWFVTPKPETEQERVLRWMHEELVKQRSHHGPAGGGTESVVLRDELPQWFADHPVFRDNRNSLNCVPEPLRDDKVGLLVYRACLREINEADRAKLYEIGGMVAVRNMAMRLMWKALNRQGEPPLEAGVSRPMREAFKRLFDDEPGAESSILPQPNLPTPGVNWETEQKAMMAEHEAMRQAQETMQQQLQEQPGESDETVRTVSNEPTQENT